MDQATHSLSSSSGAAAAATHILEVLDEDAGLQLEHIQQLHNRLTEVIDLLLGQALTISQEHDLQLLQVLLNIVHIIWNVQPALHGQHKPQTLQSILTENRQV